MKNSTKSIRVLTESAILVAMAIVLSLFQPFSLPFGGGITIASMLPIVYLAWHRGVKAGLLGGFVFGVANYYSAITRYLPCFCRVMKNSRYFTQFVSSCWII